MDGHEDSSGRLEIYNTSSDSWSTVCLMLNVVCSQLGGAQGLVMGQCIVEIDRIVREVQYQLEVNLLKCNFGRVWPMWAGRPRVGMHMNRCRNEEIIVKAILCGCGLFGRGASGLVMGPCIIDRIVIREVQYQFEVNRCRNEEIIVKGNFGWVWYMCAGRPRIDHIIIREVQYQFEVNRCKNEEVNFQGFSAYSVGGDSGQDGQTDGRTDGRRR
ncbi:hypothetical protein DPMN_115553 [Dreissena polymorpha]|uniref:SRCR domain-containing protein n=1 Tax=Dreissena polymorpha TaxID=45954 RepID=A0A9D4KM29_DREPO|nr:hypothetical protein DPMN_115553 [Dreissena polymorpha]